MTKTEDLAVKDFRPRLVDLGDPVFLVGDPLCYKLGHNGSVFTANLKYSQSAGKKACPELRALDWSRP